jgi:manganese transport protein
MLAFAGPAYLVSVGYMDPGNWATDLEGGARFGYKLLWVLVMSNLMAIFLQALSARLGVVSGRDLAQACREAYPRAVSNALWVLCEVAIAACDLAEVLGAAIGLNLLLHIPLLIGILVTAGDTLVLLWLQQFRIRSLELIVVRLIVIIGACLGMEVFLARPETTGVLAGLVPALDRDSLFITIAILGATVMPHNLYLHSALVQSRRIGDSVESKRKACRYNLIDTLVALNAAMVVNIAILVLAASVFFTRGIEVLEFQNATQLLEPLLGTKAASIIFAVALICAGQASTVTGTMAGQIVMEGFLHLRMRAWLRRLFTRSIAIIPAAITVYFAGDKGAYELLLLSQAVLSVQLPFALIPLIRFTGDRSWMGSFASKRWVQTLAWLVAAVNLVLNLWLARLKLVEWLAFEGVYGKAIGVLVVSFLVGLVLLLLYVSFAPLVSRVENDGGRKQAPILFMDQVTAGEESIEQLDALMSQMHGIAFIKDSLGKYVYSGAASSAVLGLDPENVLSKSDEELWPAELAGASRKHDELVLQKLERYEGIEMIPRNGEMHSWFVLKFPIVERSSQAVFLGGVGIDITDRTRSEEQLRGLATRLQTVREKERAMASQEVHDLGQLLTALDLHLAMIGQRLTDGADAGSLSGSLGAASEILASTISSSARISRDLRPSTIDTLGLVVAVRWHAREVASRSGMELVLGSLEDVSPDPGVSIVVFRLFQGILAHLEAECDPAEVEVSLRRAGDRLRLEVSAIGNGEPAEVNQLHSLDLIEIRELTLLYGGTVSIENRPGGGTTVSVEAPCSAPFSHANGASPSNILPLL